MKYELYADIWFITNFTMDGIALWLAGKLIRQKIRFRYMMLGSLVGTIGSMSLFFLLTNYNLYQIGVHFLINPLMVLICFRSKKVKEFLAQWFITYLAVILLGGILEWSSSLFRGKKYYWICVVFALFFLMAMDRALSYFKRKKETMFDLLLVSKNGNIPLKGFFDTGNLLVDPIVNKPVHIIKKESLESKMNTEELLVRMIPFRSLGQEAGLIEAVTMEGLYILREDAPIYLEKPVFGIAKEKLFSDDRCDVILNGTCMEN